jgi:hypothetical protein
MPSLFNTTVAANYGKMTDQQTYGVGQAFTNFATRQLRLIKIVAVDDGSAVDFTDASATANSAFSVAVKALQTVAEVYAILTPGTAGFLALVAEDTVNDADVDTNVPGEYTALEAVIVAALKVSAANGGPGLSGTITCNVTTADVSSTGIAIA